MRALPPLCMVTGSIFAVVLVAQMRKICEQDG
jgi:hypothetical protein